MMSEILIEKHVESKYIEIIFCQNDNIKNYIKNNYYLSNIELLVEPRIFF